ncbi:5'-3' exoribonuclease 1 [Tupaia chinensis]|uniref:5'-3' exoribonuclease 1 n=1 Tax=Tupaia chinensis TaxID=246437 RepID=L8YF78_TUPCH|nr:5'-3' exoribonuclease 1 [Tupaia chinensis]
MGVPKFYRWISERYPCLSEVVKEHQIPEFANLYLDMNGIIHQCSHPNDDDVHFRISDDKIFTDIFHYLEVLFRIIKPRKVFFMAVDGVAPRAKMNQQRGRRFRVCAPEETTFHLLHLSLMREYIDYEFSALKEKITFKYDIERIIDDWILMGFLVGNDFIPHLPHLHINHDALPLLYGTYITILPELGGYINESGHLNLPRFEKYLVKLSDFDREHFSEVFVDLKWFESKVGNKYLNEAAGVAAEEAKNYKEKKKLKGQENSLCWAALDKSEGEVVTSKDNLEDEAEDDDLFETEFRQYKRTYYMTKMGVDIVSEFYPYHYAPFLSDIRNISTLEIHFELGKPFKPFEQLLAVLPAASKNLLPTCYQQRKSNKKVRVTVKPHLLYRPLEQQHGVIPDRDAEFRLFDRVVNVRENFSVPVGLRGTIIGIKGVKEECKNPKTECQSQKMPNKQPNSGIQNFLASLNISKENEVQSSHHGEPQNEEHLSPQSFAMVTKKRVANKKNLENKEAQSSSQTTPSQTSQPGPASVTKAIPQESSSASLQSSQGVHPAPPFQAEAASHGHSTPHHKSTTSSSRRKSRKLAVNFGVSKPSE